MKAAAVDMWKTLRVSHISTALLLLSMLTPIKAKTKEEEKEKEQKRTFLMGETTGHFYRALTAGAGRSRHVAAGLQAGGTLPEN